VGRPGLAISAGARPARAAAPPGWRRRSDRGR
jgi:hypothetical protein